MLGRSPASARSSIPLKMSSHDIAAGRMVIVTDDADRENEGDLVMAAEKVTPEAINFMAKHGRGLICVADLQRARRAARPPAHGRAEPRKLSHRFHRLGRCRERRDHRHQRARPRRHDPDARRSRSRRRKIWCSRATSFRCAPRTAASCGAPAIPKRRSISPDSPVCNPPGCFAKSCTTTAPWRGCRS